MTSLNGPSEKMSFNLHIVAPLLWPLQTTSKAPERNPRERVFNEWGAASDSTISSGRGERVVIMGLKRIGKRRSDVYFRALAWMRTWPAPIAAGLIYAARPPVAERAANQPASAIELYSGRAGSSDNNGAS